MTRRLPYAESDIIRRLMVTKMGLDPGVLRQADPALAGQYDSQWAPVERLTSLVSALPAGALHFLANHPEGRLRVSSRSGYVAGEFTWREQLHRNVAFFSLYDLESPFTCMCITANLLDHLLGCHGEADGRWLSDGGGTTPDLETTGSEINQLYHLGYGIDEEARQAPSDYLARSLAWFIEDRRALNVADPRMERLLGRTLMNESFWTRWAPVG